MFAVLVTGQLFTVSGLPKLGGWLMWIDANGHVNVSSPGNWCGVADAFAFFPSLVLNAGPPITTSTVTTGV